MRIGANIPSMRAYNNMSKAHIQLGKSTEKLSSGSKINKSVDDPAGLSIGNKINLQTKGISQAMESSANGVSLVQTAEGALGEMHLMLQRIRDLCVKGANDSNDTNDKEKIQNEVTQLLEEVDSISSKTEYNKIKVLNGEIGRIIKPQNTDSKNAKILNVSSNVPFGEINLAVMAEETNFKFLPDSTKTSPNLSVFIGKEIGINGINIQIGNNETIDTLFSKLQETLNKLDFKIIKGTGGKVFDGITANNSGSKQNLEISGDSELLKAIGMEGFLQGKLDYSLNPPTPYTISGTATFAVLGADAKVSIAIGDTFTPNLTYTSDGGKITIKDINDSQVQINLNGASSGTSLNYVTKEGPMIIQVGANKDMGMYLDIPRVDSETLGANEINVMTTTFASNSITIADNSVNKVSDVRSRLGAYLNRLESAISNLGNAEIDSRSSYSRIMDTDMAAEITEYSKNNIIFQAGTAILSQSNMRPQSILQLIQ